MYHLVLLQLWQTKSLWSHDMRFPKRSHQSLISSWPTTITSILQISIQLDSALRPWWQRRYWKPGAQGVDVLIADSLGVTRLGRASPNSPPGKVNKSSDSRNPLWDSIPVTGKNINHQTLQMQSMIDYFILFLYMQCKKSWNDEMNSASTRRFSETIFAHHPGRPSLAPAQGARVQSWRSWLPSRPSCREATQQQDDGSDGQEELGAEMCLYIYIYGHRPLQGLPFLILEGGDAIEIFTTK